MRPPRSSSPWRATDLRPGIASLLALAGFVLVSGCSSLGLPGAAANGEEPASSGTEASREPGSAGSTAGDEEPRCVWWQPWCEKSQDVVPKAPADRFWHKLVGKGRFKVRDGGMYGDGQQAYKRLRREEALNAYLDCQGVPSFIEVVRVHPDGKPIADLIYRGSRTCGTVRIEPSRLGYLIARPIQPCAAPSTPPKKNGPDTPPETPALVCNATEAQQDECLFEEWRQDCQDLCKSCGTYPWCEN